MDTFFSLQDYQSKDGMMTSIWGPCLWHTMHTMSFNYPVEPSREDILNYYRFYYSLKDTLPCRACRENYQKNLKLLKFGIKWFKNRDTLSQFVYLLHETVNKDLGKKSNLSYEEVRERFEHFRSRCVKDNKGCTKPMYGVKSKCVMKIIPMKDKCDTLSISPKCMFNEK